MGGARERPIPGNYRVFGRERYSVANRRSISWALPPCIFANPPSPIAGPGSPAAESGRKVRGRPAAGAHSRGCGRRMWLWRGGGAAGRAACRHGGRCGAVVVCERGGRAGGVLSPGPCLGARLAVGCMESVGGVAEALPTRRIAGAGGTGQRTSSAAGARENVGFWVRPSPGRTAGGGGDGGPDRSEGFRGPDRE